MGHSVLIRGRPISDYKAGLKLEYDITHGFPLIMDRRLSQGRSPLHHLSVYAVCRFSCVCI